MKSLLFFLGLTVVLTGFVAPPNQAQPELPSALPSRSKEPAPDIDPEAQKLVAEMVARYAALRSYSDTTQVDWKIDKVENVEPVRQGGDPVFKSTVRRQSPAQRLSALAITQGFQATLQWQRPHSIRFEGTNSKGMFLGVSDGQKMWALAPAHPGYYVERLRDAPRVFTDADGNKKAQSAEEVGFQFDALLTEVQVGASTLDFITDSHFWRLLLSDVRSLVLEPNNVVVDGQECRVVRTQVIFDSGHSFTWRLFIAKSDGLLRRSEESNTLLGASGRIVETHSKVRANPALPVSTWDFQVPTKAKPIEYFRILNPQRLDSKLFGKPPSN